MREFSLGKGIGTGVEVNALFVRRERLNSIISFFVYGTKFAEHSMVLLKSKSTCRKEGMAASRLDAFSREV